MSTPRSMTKNAKTKARADQLLVAVGLAESRTKAQALIMAGLVYAGTAQVKKPGDLLPEGAALSVKGQEHPWVSRGGVKLAHGLDYFGFDPAGRVALDVGASTGGFTDVLLTRGAARVYAVDVGHGQLAWKLRSDARVSVLEKTNARHLTRELVPAPIGALVCDASFIGLQIVLPAAMDLCAPDAFAVALIKPQFEAGPAHVGKGGVVRDAAVHAVVCDRIVAWWSAVPGWRVLGVTRSPITGPEGNVEFLIGAVKGASE
jgi:23S rRNA (cytidine1920-2'-O)/16S rRNA (cytidine1409-2'-O)-methyltransferase